mgnify:CR=1 FL=1
MLTLEQVKKILDDPAISDQEALEIRDQLYALAEIIFEKWQQEREAARAARHKPEKPQAGQ